MSIIERLTSLFAPDDCLVCCQEGRLLCRQCLPTLIPVTGRCFSCRAPTSGVSCIGCLALFPATTLQAATDYSGNAKVLVGRLKFHGNQSAAGLMATLMSQRCDIPFAANTIVSYVPATTTHVRQRGFDQAALIARSLAAGQRLPFVSAVRRSGDQHQFGADRETRLQQLSASIRVVQAAQLKGAHVILIDDVLTTGTSLRIASQQLRAAGVVRVDAIAFAQAID